MHPHIALERIRTALVGATLKNIQPGKNNALTLGLTGKAGGEWRFAVQHCGWDVFGVDGELLAHEESERDERDGALAQLKGVALDELQYESESGDVSLAMEDGAMLALYTPDEEDAKPYLIISTPDGSTLTVGPGKKLDYREG